MEEVRSLSSYRPQYSRGHYRYPLFLLLFLLCFPFLSCAGFWEQHAFMGVRPSFFAPPNATSPTPQLEGLRFELVCSLSL